MGFWKRFWDVVVPLGPVPSLEMTARIEREVSPHPRAQQPLVMELGGCFPTELPGNDVTNRSDLADARERGEGGLDAASDGPFRVTNRGYCMACIEGPGLPRVNVAADIVDLWCSQLNCLHRIEGLVRAGKGLDHG
ncbi:hypothetical protein LCGC14_1099070 [marine sediment metagenome]|uniref:Uncharacterized protein n=1 Tax=marine sediment metagenome TaxID=412755 RepID=A0A0F9QG72_9ZZZZ